MTYIRAKKISSVLAMLCTYALHAHAQFGEVLHRRRYTKCVVGPSAVTHNNIPIYAPLGRALSIAIAQAFIMVSMPLAPEGSTLQRLRRALKLVACMWCGEESLQQLGKLIDVYPSNSPVSPATRFSEGDDVQVHC